MTAGTNFHLVTNVARESCPREAPGTRFYVQSRPCCSCSCSRLPLPQFAALVVVIFSAARQLDGYFMCSSCSPSCCYAILAVTRFELLLRCPLELM